MFRARTAREFQTIAADAAAVPIAGREFSRTERLLIRFDAYGPGSEKPSRQPCCSIARAARCRDVPIAAGTAGIDASDRSGPRAIRRGEYLVEINAKRRRQRPPKAAFESA